MFQYRSVTLAKIAFQACSFNHSDISPFKWNQRFTGQWLSPETRIVSEIVSDLLMWSDHLRARGWRVPTRTVLAIDARRVKRFPV